MRGRQSSPPPGVQDLLRFGRREDTALAEDVVPLGQALGGDGRDHLVDHQPQKARAVVLEFRRQLVRAHERRRQLDWLLRGKPADRRAASSARSVSVRP